MARAARLGVGDGLHPPTVSTHFPVARLMGTLNAMVEARPERRPLPPTSATVVGHPRRQAGPAPPHPETAVWHRGLAVFRAARDGPTDGSGRRLPLLGFGGQGLSTDQPLGDVAQLHVLALRGSPQHPEGVVGCYPG
jgi:hypothetical protein